MNDFGKELWRTKNLLRLDYLFDLLLRQAFEHMTSLLRRLKRCAHRFFLSRPATRHDFEIRVNLLPQEFEALEKIQTRVGIIDDQETWLNASHSVRDARFIHNKAAFGFLGRS